jgi:Zn-dependent M28 family amino/carboxypeptidase
MGHSIRNVIGKSGEGNPWIILGAHFDTRIYADRDPDPTKRSQPVPGANDGASGVAVLLEIARVFPEQYRGEIWLVFFDAEDNGGFPGWDWILGSSAFVEQLQGRPEAAIIVDMIGDADLNIYLERNSNAELSQSIWREAAELGYSSIFINEPKFGMLDDHTPFLMAGIPAVDIIDFDYPYYHTTADTPDKVSAESLKAVGDTLLSWLADYP